MDFNRSRRSPKIDPLRSFATCPLAQFPARDHTLRADHVCSVIRQLTTLVDLVSIIVHQTDDTVAAGTLLPVRRGAGGQLFTGALGSIGVQLVFPRRGGDANATLCADSFAILASLTSFNFLINARFSRCLKRAFSFPDSERQ